MLMKKIMISNIPTIIWGEDSDKIYVYVHGKMSCKESAKSFAQLAEQKGYQVISFDLPEHGERTNHKYRCDIWNGINDLTIIAEYVFSNWKHVALYACSLGAYFSLNAYTDRKFEKCLFLSPIVNMEYLIKQMFIWFNITPEQLQNEKEIDTPVDILRWDYYQYVKEHSIDKWNTPTFILYGAKDTMQSSDVIQNFANRFQCDLKVSSNSEHPFMSEKDQEIVRRWQEEKI